LATSTLVHLHLEKFVIHNRKYFILCIGAISLRRRTTVLWYRWRGCRCVSDQEEVLCLVTSEMPSAMRAGNRMRS